MIRISVFILAAFISGRAIAQSSLSDIKAAIGSKSNELSEVDALLASPDRNERLAAMELLIGSGNPVFVKRAKEIGLFSSDSELRAVALKATLNAGGPFTLVLDLSVAKDKKHQMQRWLTAHEGSWTSDLKTGTFVFSVAPYNEESRCWHFVGAKNCAFRVSGETLSLQHWHHGSGALKLQNDGSATGTFMNTHRGQSPVPATIQLID